MEEQKELGKVSAEDAKIFMKLYAKYLQLKAETDYLQMECNLRSLPTNAIDRCLGGKKFFDDDFDLSKLDKAIFGFGGLYDYKEVEAVAS